MSRSDHASVRFPCPRCFARLKASATQAGTRRRCPQCQWVFDVPTEDRGVEPHEVYGFSHGTPSSPAAEQTYIAVDCPVCGTRLAATEDQVGQRMACPDCHTEVVVPAAEAGPVEDRQRPPDVSVEGYALSDEVDADESRRGPRAADQTYIPVTCPLCDTLMKVAENQVGREVVCPDCQVPTIVRRPAEAPAAKKPIDAGQGGEYGLREQSDRPAASSPEFSSLTAVVCLRCGTRLHVAADRVSEEMACPDCDDVMIVAPPPAKRKHDPRDDDVGEYELRETDEGPAVADRRLPRQPDAASPRRSAPGQTPPRWLFFSGVFGIPVHRNTWPRFLALSCWAMVAPWLGVVASAIERDNLFSWLSQMLLTTLAGMIGFFWAMVTSVHCLTILQETAAGNDQIESWPGGLFLDWIAQCLYVFNSLLLSILVGVILAWAVGPDHPWAWLLLLGGVLVLFPVTLLSMLETGSALIPFSRPVWGSLFSVWRAWGLFHLETIAMLLPAGWIVRQTWALMTLLGVVVSSMATVAMAMIYFRLLGRLAYRCSETFARASQPADATGSGEEDEDAHEPRR